MIAWIGGKKYFQWRSEHNRTVDSEFIQSFCHILYILRVNMVGIIFFGKAGLRQTFLMKLYYLTQIEKKDSEIELPVRGLTSDLHENTFLAFLSVYRSLNNTWKVSENKFFGQTTYYRSRTVLPVFPPYWPNNILISLFSVSIPFKGFSLFVNQNDWSLNFSKSYKPVIESLVRYMRCQVFDFNRSALIGELDSDWPRLALDFTTPEGRFRRVCLGAAWHFNKGESLSWK